MTTEKPPYTCQSRYASAILEALQCQGQANDCAPFTIATILDALHIETRKGAEIATEMNRVAWRGILPVIRRVPNWATFPWGMVNMFKQYGLKARWRFNATTSDLMSGLEQNRILMPIIASWKPLWAHVMTLIVYDEAQGWGFANTQNDDHKIHWVSNETFLRQWKASRNLLVEIINVL